MKRAARLYKKRRAREAREDRKARIRHFGRHDIATVDAWTVAVLTGEVEQ